MNARAKNFCLRRTPDPRRDGCEVKPEAVLRTAAHSSMKRAPVVRHCIKTTTASASPSRRCATNANAGLASLSCTSASVPWNLGMCLSRIGHHALSPESGKALQHSRADIDRQAQRLIELSVGVSSLAPGWVGRWFRPDGSTIRAEIADRPAAALPQVSFEASISPGPPSCLAQSYSQGQPRRKRISVNP